MKKYTLQEKSEAKKNLPKPVFDFLGSQALSNIYMGLGKKNSFNLRELMVISEITNCTLMGLEPESALETNLHQLLPELSNEKARELVADINDRIFKEARRRVTANILEPEEPWDEANLGPKNSFKRPLSDEEVEALPDDPPDVVAKLEKEPDEIPVIWDATVETPDIPDSEFDAIENAAENSKESARPQTSPIASIPLPDNNTTVIKPVLPSRNIVSEKLSQPSSEKTVAVAVERPIQKITAPPPPPRLKGDSDPYREIPD